MTAHHPSALPLLALAALLAVAPGCPRGGAPPGEEKTAMAPPAPAPEPVAQPLAAATVRAAPVAPAKDPCAAICLHGRRLGCRRSMADCLNGCAVALGDPRCASPRRAFGACLGREPGTRFACDEEGMPALAEGFCETE